MVVERFQCYASLVQWLSSCGFTHVLYGLHVYGDGCGGVSCPSSDDLHLCLKRRTCLGRQGFTFATDGNVLMGYDIHRLRITLLFPRMRIQVIGHYRFSREPPYHCNIHGAERKNGEEEEPTPQDPGHRP